MQAELKIWILKMNYSNIKADYLMKYFKALDLAWTILFNSYRLINKKSQT